eukprot:14637278-Heterocapsa_arctica.AAC.1
MCCCVFFSPILASKLKPGLKVITNGLELQKRNQQIVRGSPRLVLGHKACIKHDVEPVRPLSAREAAAAVRKDERLRGGG